MANRSGPPAARSQGFLLNYNIGDWGWSVAQLHADQSYKSSDLVRRDQRHCGSTGDGAYDDGYYSVQEITDEAEYLSDGF